jgi:hypothetical protein
MALEDRRAQHDMQVVDKYNDPRVNYAMSTRDYVLRPYANNATGALILVLPPVAEAKGRFYSIIARDADAVNTITIIDRSDSECFKSSPVLNAPCDGVLCYSDGLAWLVFPNFWPGTPHTGAPETRNPSTAAPTTLATTIAPTTFATSIAPTTTS